MDVEWPVRNEAGSSKVGQNRLLLRCRLGHSGVYAGLFDGLWRAQFGHAERPEIAVPSIHAVHGHNGVSG